MSNLIFTKYVPLPLGVNIVDLDKNLLRIFDECGIRFTIKQIDSYTKILEDYLLIKTKNGNYYLFNMNDDKLIPITISRNGKK